MSPKSYTTTEAAKVVGVSRATIQAWVKDGVVKPPNIQSRPGRPPVRLWSSLDVNRLKSVKKEMQNRIGRPKGQRAKV
jgi:predicted site-specific integrase-resolvase